MVLIDMSMPDKCLACPCYYKERCCVKDYQRIDTDYKTEKPEWCPLIEVDKIRIL